MDCANERAPNGRPATTKDMNANSPTQDSQPPATSQKLGDQVYDALAVQIAAGRYPIGSRLPSELDLAKQFGVSRPVLRQALGRLRAEGLVTARQGAGNFVRRRNESRRLDFGPLENIPDVQRCLEFRCGLESQAARRAAIMHDDDAIRSIALAMDAMERAIAAGGSAVEADFEFHLAIGRAARNRFFVTTLEALRSQVEFGINLSRSFSTRPMHERLNSILAEHREIYEAIRNGDAELAQRAVTQHLEAGIARLFR
jgi:GntR family transcriptional regulator, transcriptional repressor for pyruvate dehydrogenase complex